MVKQKLLENKRNVLKIISTEGNALAISNTYNYVIELLLKMFLQ